MAEMHDFGPFFMKNPYEIVRNTRFRPFSMKKSYAEVCLFLFYSFSLFSLNFRDYEIRDYVIQDYGIRDYEIRYCEISGL